MISRQYLESIIQQQRADDVYLQLERKQKM